MSHPKVGGYGSYGSYGPYGMHFIISNLYGRPLLVWATPTPTLIPFRLHCLPSPQIFDPPEGKSFAAKNTILRWRSDYELKPDEVFDILMSNDGKRISLGTTREKVLPVDF